MLTPTKVQDLLPGSDIRYWGVGYHVESIQQVSSGTKLTVATWNNPDQLLVVTVPSTTTVGLCV